MDRDVIRHVSGVVRGNWTVCAGVWKGKKYLTLSDDRSGCLTTSFLRMAAMRQGREAKQRYGDDGLVHARRLIAQVSRTPTTVASSPTLMLPELRGTAFQPKRGPGTRRSADMRMRPMAGMGVATSREPLR